METELNFIAILIQLFTIRQALLLVYEMRRNYNIAWFLVLLSITMMLQAVQAGGYYWLIHTFYPIVAGSFLYLFIVRMREIYASLPVANSLALEEAHIGIIRIDENGIILYYNSAICYMLSYTKEYLIGKKLSTILPEHNRSEHRIRFATYLEKGVKYLDWRNIPSRLLTARGVEIPVFVSVAELFDKERQFVIVIREDK